VARSDQDAAGRLLEGAGDRIPREMTVRHSCRQNPAYRPTAQRPFRVFRSGGPVLRVIAFGPIAAFAGAAALSCRRSAPSPTPAPVPSPVAQHHDSSIVGARAARPPRPDTTAYEITTTGTIAPTGDSTARRDTVMSSTVIRATTQWDSSARRLRVTGTVQSRITRTTPRLGTRSTRTVEPVAFDATIDTASGAITFATESNGEGTSAITCPAASTGLIDEVRDHLSSVPRSLVPGTTWEDTTVSTSCRGEIPVTATVARHFAVSRAPGAATITVAHTSDAELHGTATHGTQIVSLTALGGGQTMAEYDPTSGRLIRLHGTTDLDLTIGTGSRLRQLHQHAEIIVIASPSGAP
jgi:hypothetical protein